MAAYVTWCCKSNLHEFETWTALPFVAGYLSQAAQIRTLLECSTETEENTRHIVCLVDIGMLHSLYSLY